MDSKGKAMGDIGDRKASEQRLVLKKRESKRLKVDNVRYKDYIVASLSSQSKHKVNHKLTQSITSTTSLLREPTLLNKENRPPITEWIPNMSSSVNEADDVSRNFGSEQSMELRASQKSSKADLTSQSYSQDEVNTSTDSGPLNSSAPQYLSNESASEEEPSQGMVVAKKRGVGKDWVLVENFEDPVMAEEKMASLKDFAREYQHKTSSGRKTYFYCKQKPCSAKYQLFYNGSSTIMLKSSEHDHVDGAMNPIPPRLTRIPEETKSKIQELREMKLKPKAIVSTLRNKHPEIKQPTLKQLYGLNSRQTKDQRKISLGELEQWLTDRSAIPDNEHAAFVVKFEIDYEAPHFRFFLSTKNLLQKTTMSKIVHADTTYKLNYEGFPVLVVGVTDLDRHFHPSGIAVCTDEKTADFTFLFQALSSGIYRIFCIYYVPTTLVSDAAEAIHNGFKAVFGLAVLIIMCWAHVKRAIRKRYRSKANIEDILKDLDLLQVSPSIESFQIGLKMFFEKWKMEVEFIEYFKEQWVDQNGNWFEGVQKFTPKTDNALEGKNKWIKDSHTLRERVPLSQFLNDLLIMVNDWSSEYIQDKKFITVPTVDLPLWTTSYQWVKLAKRVTILQNNDVFIFKVPATGFDAAVEFNLNECKSLDDFKKFGFACYTVEMPSNDWKKGTCTCPAFYKKFICKHLVGMAMRYKLVEAPSSAKNVPIGQKRKRGRPRKAKHALIVD